MFVSLIVGSAPTNPTRVSKSFQKYANATSKFVLCEKWELFNRARLGKWASHAWDYANAKAYRYWISFLPCLKDCKGNAALARWFIKISMFGYFCQNNILFRLWNEQRLVNALSWPITVCPGVLFARRVQTHNGLIKILIFGCFSHQSALPSFVSMHKHHRHPWWANRWGWSRDIACSRYWRAIHPSRGDGQSGRAGLL